MIAFVVKLYCCYDCLLIATCLVFGPIVLHELGGVHADQKVS